MGQKQTEVGSDFVAKEAWSGKLSQFNVWNWALEDFYLENAAECRSDLLGNMVVDGHLLQHPTLGEYEAPASVRLQVAVSWINSDSS